MPPIASRKKQERNAKYKALKNEYENYVRFNAIKVSEVTAARKEVKSLEEGIRLAIAITNDETVKLHLIKMLEGR